MEKKMKLISIPPHYQKPEKLLERLEKARQRLESLVEENVVFEKEDVKSINSYLERYIPKDEYSRWKREINNLEDFSKERDEKLRKSLVFRTEVLEEMDIKYKTKARLGKSSDRTIKIKYGLELIKESLKLGILNLLAGDYTLMYYAHRGESKINVNIGFLKSENEYK